MILKKAKYKNITVKHRKCVSQEVHGCDECKSVIDEYPNEENRLDITVFRHNNEKTEDLHFCSWECVLKHIPKIKSDYFVRLPFIYYDQIKGHKRGSHELIKILSDWQKNKKQ